MIDDLFADETGGQLLDQETLSGVEGLDVEVIREHYDDMGTKSLTMWSGDVDES